MKFNLPTNDEIVHKNMIKLLQILNEQKEGTSIFPRETNGELQDSFDRE